MSLIPHADSYLAHGLNVLLIAKHGVGKTESVIELARRHGLACAHYSCALLDPWTDLVGVPMPQTDPATGEMRLEMARPQEPWDAELIFLDELNRADTRTMNAVFELVGQRSINGRPLPKLRAVWAAINPPDGEYDVQDMDPALIDRFDTYVELHPSPCARHLAQKLGAPIANALVAWWSEHEAGRLDETSYVSPRRLEKVGRVFLKTGQVRSALPPWGRYDIDALHAAVTTAGGLGAGSHMLNGKRPEPAWRYTPTAIRRDSGQLAEWLRANPKAHPAHHAVIKALTGISGNKLIDGYAEVLDAVEPTVAEAWYAELSQSRRTRLSNAAGRLAAADTERYARLERLPALLLADASSVELAYAYRPPLDAEVASAPR